MSTFAQIVGARMDDDRTAQDALGTDQFHLSVLDAALTVSLTVGLEVAQVAHVAVGVCGGSVFFGVGVDYMVEGKLKVWGGVGGMVSWDWGVCVCVCV